MTLVTGMGCSATAVTAAHVAVASSPLAGAVAGMAADMILRPKAKPKTEAGKALQSVTDVVDNAANDVMRKMR